LLWLLHLDLVHQCSYVALIFIYITPPFAIILGF